MTDRQTDRQTRVTLTVNSQEIITKRQLLILVPNNNEMSINWVTVFHSRRPIHVLCYQLVAIRRPWWSSCRLTE